MLTPVDLQQKKFQHGMGYTKKDVDSFFDIVVMSYTELYKSNAELTKKKLRRMQMTRLRSLKMMPKSRQIT